MKLENIIARVLNIDIHDIQDTTSPQNCPGWTSLQHLLLIKELCTAYHITLSFSAIKSLHTVGEIKKLLREKGVYHD